mgnify:CR=1 FL=1
MEKPTSGSAFYRVLGIDPGGDAIGFAVLSYHLETHRTALTYAHTLKASKVVRHYPEVSERYGDRFARQVVIRTQYEALLKRFSPQAVACESPFLGRFPQAFMSLTECLQTLRIATFDNDPGLAFDLIDPKSVKKAVDTDPGKKDKTLVARGVNALGLDNLTGRPILSYDEHTTDAIAVAWWRLKPLIT